MGAEGDAAASGDLLLSLGFSGDGEGLDAPGLGTEGDGEGVGEEEKKAVIWLCFRTSGERPLLAGRDAIADASEGMAAFLLLSAGLGFWRFAGGIAGGRGLVGRRRRVGEGNGAEKWREREVG